MLTVELLGSSAGTDNILHLVKVCRSPSNRRLVRRYKQILTLRLRYPPHLSICRKIMIRIITVEREYGSGAARIAEKLAARLGWKLWDQLLTREIARLAHCEQSAIEKREERRDPLYYRLLKSFAQGSYEGSSTSVPVDALDADAIVRISLRVVEQAAASGKCVIVGRGSQHFLRARADTLRFFLYASREEKMRRLVSQSHTEGDAEMLVNTIDGERAAFIKRYFHAEWPDRSIYHAMINTDSGDETVVQAILSFLQQPQMNHYDRASCKAVHCFFRNRSLDKLVRKRAALAPHASPSSFIRSHTDQDATAMKLPSCSARSTSSCLTPSS